MQRIVISGAGGFIGKSLSADLTAGGFEVVKITRSSKAGSANNIFRWDPRSSFIEKGTFRNGDIIIHLAGANIGSRRWSRKRKEEIVSSRVGTARLIYENTIGAGIRPGAFITASATGYYGAGTSQKIYGEEDPHGNDFLGETCYHWEAASDLFITAGVRVVKIRTAVVLAPSGSALDKLLLPAKAGMIIRIGPGSQYFPWIHVRDLCSVYLKAVTDEAMAGVYNAAAPGHITLDGLMYEIAGQRHLPVFLPRIPAWLIRLILGEMSVVLTAGSRVSCDKLSATGFVFTYPEITSALKAC